MSEQVKLVNPCKVDSSLPCRLCLEEGSNLQDIYKMGNMIWKIQHFLQIEVSEADEVPLVICSMCVSQIDEWGAYYTRVRNNDYNLQARNVVGIGDVVDRVARIKKDYALSEEVVCTPKLEDEYDLIEEVETQEDELLIEDAQEDCGVMAMDGEGVDDANEDTDAENEQAINQQRKNKRGRPPKKTKTLEYLMQRDAEDELIRQTLSLNCDICPNTSATFEERLVHYKDMHSDAHGYVKCCGKEFKKRTLLLDHAKLHINPDEYACPQCKKRFTSQIYLADHVVTHLPKEERPFQCEQCQKRYPTRHRLVYHQKTSHNEDLNVPCPLCEKSYRTDAFLKNHIKRVHEMADQHICEICARVFKTKVGFLEHQLEHLETPPERIKCEICGGKFKNKATLKQHMARHERPDERHNCDVCHKDYRTKKQLYLHRKYVHPTDSQMLPCTLCDKTFKRPWALKEHMASHTGQMLYTCLYCPREFNSNANKYTHQKAQHPLEWEATRRERVTAGVE